MEGQASRVRARRKRRVRLLLHGSSGTKTLKWRVRHWCVEKRALTSSHEKVMYIIPIDGGSGVDTRLRNIKASVWISARHVC